MTRQQTRRKLFLKHFAELTERSKFVPKKMKDSKDVLRPEQYAYGLPRKVRRSIATALAHMEWRKQSER